MDARPANHYVRGVELLLFLTAMLAGLLSGDRAVEARQVEPREVAAAALELAAPVAEAATEAVAARPLPLGFATPLPLPNLLLVSPAPRLALRVDERRLE